MPNIEFGEWITIDTTVPRKKRAAKKQPLIEKVVVPKIHISNACHEGFHKLCDGRAYIMGRKSYAPCDCTCGICEAFEYSAEEKIERAIALIDKSEFELKDLILDILS